MAIYRSDQASVTFAAEAAQGGYPEVGTITSAANPPAGAATSVGVTPAGSATLVSTVVIGAASDNLKMLIVVGNDSKLYGPREVRRMVGGGGTTSITLDTPFGFNHPEGAEIKILATRATGTADAYAASSGGVMHDSLDHGKYITWFPGVYESVDCPDPEQAFEPRYVLGNLTNRNFYQMYAGNETLTGSIGGMIMLNGFPLRFPIGKVVTVPVAALDTNTKRTLASATVKGDLYIKVTNADAQVLAAGDYVLFGNATTAAPVDTFYTSTSVRADGDKVNYEIRQVELGAAATTAVDNIKLNVPLQFAHKSGDRIFKLPTPAASTYYKHSIIEQVALDSLTWNVNILDDTGANPWQRRYMGGKVGSMTLTAESGGLLTGGWEGVNFLDMVHNRKSHPDLPTNQPMPRYTAMQNITSADVGRPTAATAVATFVRPATAPYYYSQGSIKMFGDGHPHTDASTTEAELARIASFSLSVSNSPEPKYYVSTQYDGRRVAKEQFEGNREYTMSASIATNDSEDHATANTRDLFKELLLAGDYRGTTAGTGFRGFGINLKFIRDIDGSQNDYIEIIIPDDGTAARGGLEQGAFIRAAPHNIGEDSPITADADIVFRSLVIRVQDTEPIYP